MSALEQVIANSVMGFTELLVKGMSEREALIGNLLWRVQVLESQVHNAHDNVKSEESIKQRLDEMDRKLETMENELTHARSRCLDRDTVTSIVQDRTASSEQEIVHVTKKTAELEDILDELRGSIFGSVDDQGLTRMGITGIIEGMQSEIDRATEKNDEMSAEAIDRLNAIESSTKVEAVDKR